MVTARAAEKLAQVLFVGRVQGDPALLLRSRCGAKSPNRCQVAVDLERTASHACLPHRWDSLAVIHERQRLTIAFCKRPCCFSSGRGGGVVWRATRFTSSPFPVVVLLWLRSWHTFLMIATHVITLMRTLSKTWEGNGTTPVSFERPTEGGDRSTAHLSVSSARVQLHFNRRDMVLHCLEKHYAGNATKIHQRQQSLWLV